MWRLGVAAMVAMLVAVACGSSDDRLSEPLPTTSMLTSRFVEAAHDAGVTDEHIRIGVLADLSGPQAARDVQIVDGHKAYWASQNADGGLGGRRAELVIVDTGGDVATHTAGYDELSVPGPDGVVAIGYSSGTEATRSIAPQALSDQLMIITGSRHSANISSSAVFSLHTSLCLEAMNSVAWLDRRVRDQTSAPLRLAIVGDGSADADDAVAGARLAAADLGLEIVLDEGAGVDGVAVDRAQPTGVFIAGSQRFLQQVLGTSGTDALWVGSSQTLALESSSTLDDGLGVKINDRYFHAWPLPAWGSAAGSGSLPAQLENAVVEGARPDWYLIGWIQASMLRGAMTRSFVLADVQRSSVLEVASTARFRFDEMAPPQSWQGNRADRIMRESYVYDLVGWGETSGVGLTQAGGPDPSAAAESYEGAGGCGPPPPATS